MTGVGNGLDPVQGVVFILKGIAAAVGILRQVESLIVGKFLCGFIGVGSFKKPTEPVIFVFGLSILSFRITKSYFFLCGLSDSR